MKGFITAVSVFGAAAMFAVWALIELVARLAPVLLVGIVAWAVFAGVRARCRRDRYDDRLRELWAQTPRVGRTGPSVRQPVAMPLLRAPHYESFYLVRGDDTSFAVDRGDGYLNFSAPSLPPAIAHQPRVPALRRRARRRRSTRRSTRP
ncbi:MAG: hypothetical protein ACRDTK_00760 [Mycobacterium sp.]